MDILTEDNYYSPEMNNKYCSVSQFKNFIGYPFKEGCEARALAELRGEYEQEKTNALLVGSYVDTALTDSANLDKFKAENPQMYSTRGATAGQLKSEFIQAQEMCDRVKKDKKFMWYMDGEHQKIMTGNLFGLDFKIKIDTYKDGVFFSDLKTTEAIRKSYFSTMHNRYVSFIEYFDYILQGAIYQEVIRQNTGKTLPFYICAVSKEKVTDFEVIQIDNDTLHAKIHGDMFGGGIADSCQLIRRLKSGDIKPCNCGYCDYCKKTKTLKGVLDWREISGKI